MRRTQIFLFFTLLFLGCSYAFAQDSHHKWFHYFSPLPGSDYVIPEQKISFRLKEELSLEMLQDFRFTVMGSVSGQMKGELKITADNSTVIFTPANPFASGEEVQVMVHFPRGLDRPDFTTHFSITSLSQNDRLTLLQTIREEEKMASIPLLATSLSDKNSMKALNDSLPEGFPEITITHWDDPSPGYVFVSPLAYDNNRFFMTILDNYATPVFYQEIPPTGGTDFKMQPNGLLTIFLYTLNKYVVYDSNYEAIDTIAAGNGYTADLHELRYYPDGSSFLLAYDPQIVDMSEIVPGGQEDAVVVGLIVQELDQDKEVVFQWRSWDHFQITDASNWIDLTGNLIDYVHGNSIEIISQDEMMICSRNMNEITKIDRNTGDIIWRLNGKNNMFEFIQPADSFCIQHSIRMMPDSTNISLFDNGGCWSPKYSSAAEFALDEENFTCTLVNRFQSDPDIFGAFMGNTQRLFNGHTINGWGSGIPSVTEFDEEGNILLQFSFPHLNYRAFKYDWQQTVFSSEEESIDFGAIPYTDSAYAMITLVNHHDNDISINQIVHHTSQFMVTNALPILLGANETTQVEIKFIPDTSMQFNDVFTFCWDISSDTLIRRISTQVSVSGEGTGNEGVSDLQAAGFSMYPNPFENTMIIKSSTLKMESISIFTLDGQKISFSKTQNKQNIQLQLDVPPGTYILRIKAEDGNIYSGKITRN